MYGYQRSIENFKSNTTTDDLLSPVSASELKDWLRLDNDDENDKLDMILVSATSKAIAYINMELLSRSWKLKLDRFPEQVDGFTGLSNFSVKKSWIELPMTPLLSISSFKISNEDFVDYTLDLEGGRILSDNFNKYSGEYEIDYVAGFNNASDVPKEIKIAILMIAGFIYEHNGVCDSTDMLNRSGAMELLNPFRTFKGAL